MIVIFLIFIRLFTRSFNNMKLFLTKTIVITLLIIINVGIINNVIYAGILNDNVYRDDNIEAECSIDNTYLFLHIKTNDRSFQMQIINFGLIINIDNIINNKNVLSIEYPIIQKVPPPPPNMDRQELSDIEKEEMEINFKKRTEKLVYVKNGLRNVINLNNDLIFTAKIDNSPEKLIYNIKVPIKYIKDKNIETNIKKINVVIKTPIINYKELKYKFGIPKEDRRNGNNPPKYSKYKPSELNIDNVNIKISNILIP